MKKGFTLIEMMVVIGIIGIVIAFVIPNFAAMQRQARIRAAAQELAQDLRQIRERALSTGRRFSISFPDTRTYLSTNQEGQTKAYKLAGSTGGNIWFGGVGVSGRPPEGSLPAPGVNGIDFPNNVCILDARGGATKGVIYITDGRDNYAVGINTLGKVKVYRHKSGSWN